MQQLPNVQGELHTMASGSQPAASSSQLPAQLQQLTQHLSRVDGELSSLRHMTEQLEACVLDDMRDMGVRLDAAEAANESIQMARRSGPIPSKGQSGAGDAGHPTQADAAQIRGLMEKRLRRVEVTMAGAQLSSNCDMTCQVRVCRHIESCH